MHFTSIDGRKADANHIAGVATKAMRPAPAPAPPATAPTLPPLVVRCGTVRNEKLVRKAGGRGAEDSRTTTDEKEVGRTRSWPFSPALSQLTPPTPADEDEEDAYFPVIDDDHFNPPHPFNRVELHQMMAEGAPPRKARRPVVPKRRKDQATPRRITPAKNSPVSPVTGGGKQSDHRKHDKVRRT